MTIDLQTATWPVLAAASLVFLGILCSAWWFSYFIERMWTESLTSRTVDRRMLRWQRSAFRGHLPFGHWGSPWKVAYLRATMLAWRAVVLLMAVVWLLGVGARIFGHKL